MQLIQSCQSLLQLDYQFIQVSNTLIGSAIYKLKLQKQSAFQLFERVCFNRLKNFELAETKGF